MEKEFVSYEQAVALKELGFNEPCLRFYTKSDCSSILSLDADNGDTNSYLTTLHKNYVSAPLKQQVFRWFRDVCDMSFYITRNLHFVDDNTKWNPIIGGMYYSELTFNTYEEAENGAINKLIELAKQQDNVQ